MLGIVCLLLFFSVANFFAFSLSVLEKSYCYMLSFTVSLSLLSMHTTCCDCEIITLQPLRNTVGLTAAKAAGMRCVVTQSVYSKGENFSAADVLTDDLNTGMDGPVTLTYLNCKYYTMIMLLFHVLL